jgi:hypothetical protein
VEATDQRLGGGSWAFVAGHAINLQLARPIEPDLRSLGRIFPSNLAARRNSAAIFLGISKNTARRRFADAELVGILRRHCRRCCFAAGPFVRRLAEQGFQNYLAVLVVALIALLPDVSRRALGLITISVSLGWSVWVLLRLYQSLVDVRRLKSRISSFRRHAVSLLGFGMLIYSALRMSFAPPESSSNYIFGAALIVLVSSATVASWELLLRISGLRRSD